MYDMVNGVIQENCEEGRAVKMSDRPAAYLLPAATSAELSLSVHPVFLAAGPFARISAISIGPSENSPRSARRDRSRR